MKLCFARQSPYLAGALRVDPLPREISARSLVASCSMGGAWEHTFMARDALFVYSDSDLTSVDWPLEVLPDVWFLGRCLMGWNADWHTTDALRRMFRAVPVAEVRAD